MYKVADYLYQAQARVTPDTAAHLRPLDTRGPGSAVASLWMLLVALSRLVRGRVSGKLAGVHVNMAERMSLFRKGMVVVASRLLGVPVVIHLHAQMQRFYRSLPAPLQAVVRWVFSLSDQVVVIGSGPRRFVMDELRVPARRVDIVMNGVPGPAKAPTRVPGSRRKVVFVGRLTDEKGVSDLLEALALTDLRAADVEVTFAGGGDIAGYERKAAQLKIADRVRFAGWCEQPQVDALLQDADVLVLPSHDEVMPLVVLEALANCVAVVCTPVGELPVILADKEEALFVPVGDRPALARALEQVLHDRALHARLARNGRALYERQFTLDHFFTSIARVHQRYFGVAGALPEAAASPAARNAGVRAERAVAREAVQ
jgi:glycosyltransferase involved in cell wall biosynthesis